jgi:uncharacterized membrane protein YdbT with pleckstrin-like domain
MKNKLKNKPRLDFVGQREDEKLLFIFRHHMISMRKGFYMLVIPVVITSLPLFIWRQNLGLFLLPIGGFVIGLMLFFYHFIMWYFTVYIVTDQRIRQVTQRGLFGKDVVELRLSKIQNISYNIPGFSGEVFKFGTIVIQTFVGDLVIHNVENPDKVYNKLQDALNNVIDKTDHEETIE